jgi:hypothetical protein
MRIVRNKLRTEHAVAGAEISRAQIVSRIAAGVFGGYAFVWGFTTLTIALALSAELSYLEAQTTAYLLAFLLFLGAFLWAFAARRVARVWAVLGGGGVLMTALAWALTRGG